MGSNYDLGGVAGPFTSRGACETVAREYQSLVADHLAAFKNAGRVEVTFGNRCVDDGKTATR